MNNPIWKRLSLFIVLFLSTVMMWACPVCERQQPKILKGIVHGAGPDSKWDYLIIWVVICITLLSMYYTVKWLIRPGEGNANHIKYSILNEDQS